jgi:plasmid stabilization system protein ParE
MPSTPSEYVRELIREDQKRRAQQRLEELLLEGLNSGDPVVADEKFWSDLKTEAFAQIEARRKVGLGGSEPAVYVPPALAAMCWSKCSISKSRQTKRIALRCYEAVLTTCRVLAQEPFSGKAFPTSVAALTGLRRFPVGAPFQKYLLSYQPLANGIEVVRVLNGSRDLEPILGVEAEEE